MSQAGHPLQTLGDVAARLQFAMDAAGLGDWSWDIAADRVALNPRACEIFGLATGCVPTWAALRERLHVDDREPARLAMEHALAQRADYRMDHRVLRDDGATGWIAASGRGIYSAEGSVLGVIGVVQDVSERRRADDALRDNFLATLSHELRAPLSSILGWASVLRSGTPEPDDLRRGVEVIERNARAQAQLIEDLLDMSSITSGKMRLSIQLLAPHTFVEDACQMLKPAADAKGIRIGCMLDMAAGPIAGDPNRLQQIVWNLLSNAIKFTPTGGQVQVRLERVNPHIAITVTDNGTGIAPEFTAHVFDSFRQADGSTRRRHGGLGLGLSLVKHLAELHGGTVHARSDGPGQGASFTVHLPVPGARQPPPAEREHPARAQRQVPHFDPVDLSGLRVLVVDDEADARGVVERVLRDCRAEVYAATSAPQALALVQQLRPQVLISDIGMPEMDGYDLLQRVRGLGPERGGTLTAIALTAFARAEDRSRALQAGFLVHLSKPVEPAQIVATVARAAGRGGR